MEDQRAPSAPAGATSWKSGARTEASRRNGARSRGPKTAEGKQRSAQNALRHGMRAQRFVLLDDEDGSEFEALAAALRDQLVPEGALQDILVARLTLAVWRMFRADRMEVELLNPHLALDARGRPGGLGLALIRDGHGPRAFDTLSRYRGAVQAELWRALRGLSALKGGDPAAAPPPLAAALSPGPARVAAHEPHRYSPNEPESRPNSGETTCRAAGAAPQARAVARGGLSPGPSPVRRPG
jgi:hypothetical protein